MNSTTQWNLNRSLMINLDTFTRTKQNTIFPIRTSYQDSGDLTLPPAQRDRSVSILSPSNLSLRIDLSYESDQKTLRFFKCLLILTKLSPEALEEAREQLESIHQDSEESYFYQESESQEIVNSFLSVAKSMPSEDTEYDSIYTDEELDSF